MSGRNILTSQKVNIHHSHEKEGYMKHVLSALFFFAILFCNPILATPIYLNESNISVSVGSNTTATTSNNTFSNGQTINKVIDAPSADAEEFHNQTTHIWFSGGTLELLFDFGTQYDITTLHFWNYTGEAYDVDNIDFTFFNAAHNEVGTVSIEPALGTNPGITAQNIFLPAPLNVQYVSALLSGSNGQIDFQNIGFTAELSTDRCLTNPTDPICDNNNEPIEVPEPSGIFLLLCGLFALRLTRSTI